MTESREQLAKRLIAEVVSDEAERLALPECQGCIHDVGVCTHPNAGEAWFWKLERLNDYSCKR